jgi:hypothetical protein
VFSLGKGCSGIDALREIFPTGEADEMNLVMFSTSGTNGSYITIEDAEGYQALSPEEQREENDGEDPEPLPITFVVVKPRLCMLQYGNCAPQTPEDFAFLRKLRETSWMAFQTIGRDDRPLYRAPEKDAP